MATMATQYGSMHDNVPPDEDMDMLSDRGHTDDIDIDIDVQGSYMGDDDQDIEYMVEDGHDHPDGQEAHDDDIMIDDIEEETIVEADMSEDGAAPDEQMAATEPNHDGLGDAATVSDVSIENAHSVPHSPRHVDEPQEVSHDVWHDDTLEVVPAQAQNDKPYAEVDEHTNTSEPHADRLKINEHADVLDFAAGESTQVYTAAEFEQDSSQVGEKEQQKPHPVDGSPVQDVNLTPNLSDQEVSEALAPALAPEAHATAVENHAESDQHHRVVSEEDNTEAWSNPDEQVPQEHEEENVSVHADLSAYEEEEYSVQHPVTVEWESERYSLFPPSTEDGSETYLLQDSGLTNKKMSELFEACRHVLGDSIKEDLALLIEIQELDLSIDEDSADCETATLSQVIDIYLHLCQNDGIEDPKPLYLILTTKPRFSLRLVTLMKATAELKGLSSLPKASQGDLHGHAHENGNDDSESHLDDENGALLGETEIEAQRNTADEEAEDHLHEDPNVRGRLTEEGDGIGVGEGDKKDINIANEYGAPGHASAVEQDRTTEALDGDIPETQNVSTTEDNLSGFDRSPAHGAEGDEEDDLIGYSDDEAEVDNETSRSSTIQGDLTNNQGRRDSSAPPDGLEDGRVESDEGKENNTKGEGRKFTVPDDLDFADESLSVSDAFDDEPSTGIAHGDEEGTLEKQSLDVDQTVVDLQETIGTTIPTAPTEAEFDATIPPLDPSKFPQETNSALFEEVEEHDFDFDELIDDWNNDTKEEEPFPEAAKDTTADPEGATAEVEVNLAAEENYEDDFLDLDGFESDAEGATDTEKKTVRSAESGSPLGKRTWEEHVGSIANDGDDQEVKRVKSQ